MAGGYLSADAASQTVSAISIQGNTLIPETTILSVLETKVGAVYNKDLLAKDIQHVYDIGLFSTVDVDVQADDAGMRVMFIVKERPIISRIEFEGNKVNTVFDIFETGQNTFKIKADTFQDFVKGLLSRPEMYI